MDTTEKPTETIYDWNKAFLSVAQMEKMFMIGRSIVTAASLLTGKKLPPPIFAMSNTGARIYWRRGDYFKPPPFSEKSMGGRLVGSVGISIQPSLTPGEMRVKMYLSGSMAELWSSQDLGPLLPAIRYFILAEEKAADELPEELLK